VKPDSLYPPTPAGIPADQAKPGLRYRLQVTLVLLALFLFLLLYAALLAGSFGLLCWTVWPAGEGAAPPPETWYERLFVAALRVGAFALAAMLFAFLLKGFFKRGEDEAAGYLEVTEQEQPELFHFLRALCREIGCPVPARVYLSHEVNAAVFYPTSILNLFISPPKNLLVGLGLVNGLNLVEFKALLAHELGHFSQRTLRLDGYVWVAYQVIANMVNTRDRWDNWVIRGFDMPWVSAFAVPLYALAEMTRALLKVAFRVLHRAHLSLRRQMEFNADLVAVSVAGSDAPVYVLLQGNFCQDCLQQASQELALAADQELLTRDLFFHQQRAGDRLRAAADNPNLGRRPEPSADSTRPADVFQPGETSTLAMWADHPSQYDREQNAKRRYFQSPPDDRPAWLLFRNQDALREELTRRFYRICLGVEPGETLAAAERVQAFIDEEHAAVRLDARYRGVYDNRCLELEDRGALVQEAGAQASPPREQLASSGEGLYSDELASWVAGHRRRQEEFALLDRRCSDRLQLPGEELEFRGRRYPLSEAADLREKVAAELEEDRRYLAGFDVSVRLSPFLPRELPSGHGSLPPCPGGPVHATRQAPRSTQNRALAPTDRTMALQRALRARLLRTQRHRHPVLLRLATKAPARRPPARRVPAPRGRYLPPRSFPARAFRPATAPRTGPGQRAVPSHPAALRPPRSPGPPGRAGGAVMLSLSPTLRIFLCLDAVDLRKSFDSLGALVRQALGHDPLSGHWFVFRNRAGDRLKILAWEEDGWAIWYKRLEAGVFRFPPAGGDGPPRLEIRAAELAMLLDGVVLEKVQRRQRYHREATAK
jgi:transposase/Zn-dependent protease with chaperone function